MPDKMSREDFHRWHRRRMRWILFLDTSEALLMLITFLWGCYLVVMWAQPKPDPVSLSLLQMWPRIPLWIHGLALISIAVLHSLGMRYGWRGVRRRMIMAQMIWYLYDEFSLYFAHVYPPFTTICLAYVLACVVNYISLQRPASVQEQEQCKAGR